MTKIILIILLFTLLLIVLFPKIIKREISRTSKNVTLRLLKYFFKSKSSSFSKKKKDTRKEGDVKIEQKPGASKKSNNPNNTEEYVDFEEIE